VLLYSSVPDEEVRGRIYAAIGEEKIAQASIDVSTLVRPSDDVFYGELNAKYATVKRFLPTLLRVVRFKGNVAAQPLLQALQWLRDRPDNEPPAAIVGKAWQRHVVLEDGGSNTRAFTFCALDLLRTAIRRRDVFVKPSWRYADPQAGLLTGAEWEASRPIICRSLGLTTEPDSTLKMLAQELDQT
jgi:hypothetical protein